MGLTLSLLLGALVLSILVSPALPALNLPGASILPHGVHMVPPVPAPSLDHVPRAANAPCAMPKPSWRRENERSLQHLLAEPQR